MKEASGQCSAVVCVCMGLMRAFGTVMRGMNEVSNYLLSGGVVSAARQSFELVYSRIDVSFSMMVNH